VSQDMAEREGFEPPRPFGPAAFKAAAFVHSATVPSSTLGGEPGRGSTDSPTRRVGMQIRLSRSVLRGHRAYTRDASRDITRTPIRAASCSRQDLGLE
jgi:hypothetical protein